MTQQATTITRTRPLLTALAVALIVLGALAMGARGASAQEGTTWELGNFCLDDYAKNSTCEANDVRIASITPSVEEACVAVGDTATVKFQVRLDSGANQRYDVSMFVATDGGSAWTGNSCYHDFLQPVSTDPTLIDVLSGNGPFWELESTHDMCGDIRQNEPTYYNFQQEITIDCVDNNNDGAVDPISTCTGWHNNAKNDCLTVKGADIDVPSKCTCEYMDPGVRVYRGYDWGDLPDSYKTVTADDGARHAIQDLNNDNTPDTITNTTAEPDIVVPAVWLGPTVDYSPNAETDGQPNFEATGDDNNIQNTKLVDDEDGITVSSAYSIWGQDGGQFSVNVNSSDGTTCTDCKLGFWIDWNGDGDFADPDESYLQDVTYGTQTVHFDIPATATVRDLYARFRLYDGNYNGSYLPTGLVVNGEVEDYHFAQPTAVELLSFTATAERKAIVLTWETASETDNAGFNLYRARKVDGERTRINTALIPTLVPPGSNYGAIYAYPDTTFTGNRNFYYWLEIVDIYGATQLSDPIEARAARGLELKEPPSRTEVK
ncbi:MAG: hypothetical protein GX604_07590 [Actinobacteria bacterium]|nr:hypothetical protein [Actinomycetota bacterium]